MDGWQALAILGLFVGLAGCGGSLAEFPGTASPTPTQDTRLDYVAAPGVTTDGITDPGRLARAHTAALSNRSYTRRVRTWINESSGGSAYATEELRVGPTGHHYSQKNYSAFRNAAYAADGRPPYEHEQMWSSGQVTYVRQSGRVEGDVSYYRTDTNIITNDAFEVEQTIDIFTRLNHTRVTRITHDGWIAYQVVASETPKSKRNDTAITARAIIDSFGRIHSITVRASSDAFFLIHDGGTVRMEIRYTGVGNTTAPEPAWIDTAINATDPATAAGQRAANHISR